MKLRYSATSPYVRKVMILAHESGLAEQIGLIPTAVGPTTLNEDVAAENPLVKVPTLILDDGSTLFDSRVICEYLDSLHTGEKLFPAVGPARWSALRQQALADGLLDAALLVRYESALRPGDKRWDDWIAGQMRKITQALDALETEAAGLGSALTIGAITVAAALGYLDFRFTELDWRTPRPALSAFFAGFAARASMLATAPQ